MFGKTLLRVNRIRFKSLLILAIPFITLIGLAIAASGSCATSGAGTVTCWR